MYLSDESVGALCSAFDNVFEIDFESGTLKIKKNTDCQFCPLNNIRILLEDAVEMWCSIDVYPEDAEKVREYLSGISDSGNNEESLVFRMNGCEGESPHLFSGRVVHFEDGCCLCFSKVEVINSFHDSLSGDGSKKTASFDCCKFSVGERMIRHSKLLNYDGVLSSVINNGIATFVFKTENGERTYLFINKKSCSLFGLTASELSDGMSRGETFNELIRTEPLNDEQYELLIKDGSFILYGEQGGGTVFSCSEEDGDYVVSVIPDFLQKSEKSIKITTFGYFDVFVDGVPVLFRNDKAKELLALLVDRRGGYISPSFAISCLWEDEAVNERTLARYRKTAFNLRTTLEEYGIDDILENIGGRRRLITEKVKCDLYDYLTGEEQYAGLFRGIYMLNYSWGELTMPGITEND